MNHGPIAASEVLAPFLDRGAATFRRVPRATAGSNAEKVLRITFDCRLYTYALSALSNGDRLQAYAGEGQLNDICRANCARGTGTLTVNGNM